jgi:hypothetical protein
MKKLTRREIATVIASAAVLSSQPLPQNPDEELKAAKDLVQQNLQQLAKVQLPMSTEPASHFKA